MNRLLLFGFALALSGCVSKAVQTEKFLSEKSDLPDFAQVAEVPFIDQSSGYCGPATLTMAMNAAGKNLPVDQVAALVFTPGMKGSLQSDLVGASRREGLMAVEIRGLPSLLEEVSAGHPVLVFENLALTWLPQYHYALVLGFDRSKEEIILHSGHEELKRWDMRKFERSWMLGEYWGLVVLPAGRIAASADEKANVVAAAGLEQAGRTEEARSSYRKILSRWPTSLIAKIGLANIAYQEKNFSEAARLLREATKEHPDSRIARHNLEVAESAIQ